MKIEKLSGVAVGGALKPELSEAEALIEILKASWKGLKLEVLPMDFKLQRCLDSRRL